VKDLRTGRETEGSDQEGGHLAPGHAVVRAEPVIGRRVTAPRDPSLGIPLDVGLVDRPVVVPERAVPDLGRLEEVPVRVDRLSVFAELEVEVGCGVLGIARVTDPTNELPACHKGAVGEARSDAPAFAIVGSGGVVVEMDVPGHPATAMIDREMTAIRL